MSEKSELIYQKVNQQLDEKLVEEFSNINES